MPAMPAACKRLGVLLLPVFASCILHAGCEKMEKMLFTPRVKVRCEILKNRCTFRNYGDPGRACVRVQVFHLASGRTLTSDPVCSGRIDRDAPAVVEISFPGGNSTILCMGEDLKRDFKKECRVDIEELDD